MGMGGLAELMIEEDSHADHHHGGIEQEHQNDIREGDFEAILRKLEERGAKNNIFKYKEMQKLRAVRNKRVQERLEIFGATKSVIDSS